MAKTPLTNRGGLQRYDFDLAAGDGAGGVLSVLNPHGVALTIHFIQINRTTKSTGAGTADFGVAATSILNDTLMDGLDVGAATGPPENNAINHGTNGLDVVQWGATAYLTGSKASGNMAGLVGTGFVLYSFV